MATGCPIKSDIWKSISHSEYDRLKQTLLKQKMT